MSKPKTKGKKKGAATPKRHDFLMGTVRLLRDSAGNVCSYPECHRHTHGAKASGKGALTVGVACHIKAAAPGGPRFDAEQTREERRHFSNGIWMCQTHSKLIDADNSAYSVETLLEWKRNAEARSNSQLNQKSFTENEVKKAVDAGSVSMLQRWVNQSADPLEAPIPELIRGYESSLSDLDPRFTIEVNKVGNDYRHVIQAAQDKVDIQLVLQGLDEIEGFWEAKKALIEEGRELLIPSKYFALKGSRLFEAIQQKSQRYDQGVLSIGRVKKPIVANLYLRTDKGEEVFIESFTCYYTTGTARTVFEGTALEGFITVKAYCSHEGENHKFDLTFNVESWVGKNILELPRFSRLLKAAKHMTSGRLVFELEVGSNAAAFDSKVSVGSDGFHEQLQWIIYYLDVARRIAEQCGEPLLLTEIDFDYKLYVELRKYVKLLAGPIYSKRSPGMLCAGSFDYYEGYSSRDLGGKSFPSSIKLLQQDSLVFGLLGSMIKAPRIESSYTNIDTVFFSDIEERDRPKVEIQTTADTDIMIQLHPDDSWIILESWEASKPAVISD